MADQTFRPSVNYQDNRAAIEWLQKAFGFEPSMIITDDAGKIVHSEMRFEGAEVMIAHEWSDITRSPKSIGGKNTQQIHVQLRSDIDGHCARAKAAGATIVAEPSDQFYGDRTYRATDLEGHLWTFGQAVKVVSNDEMEKASGLKIRSTL
ncbi:MAG TPA: VOC family protein [Rhizomicrobium sp.]|nr:VOC family protein [Rhizomicrobium sp.]